MSEEIKLTGCGCNDCDCDSIGQEIACEGKESNEYVESRGPISDVIRNRIEAAGSKFFCNDNISEFLEPGDREELVDEVAEQMDSVLRSMVIDVNNDHNTHDTARRVAKMFINEVFAGRYDKAPKVTSFPNASEYDGVYVVGPITVRSTCAHHFQPIYGHAWVGVYPDQKVIGLSKFNRIIDWIASRPQIQEEMTATIADELAKFAETPHIAVVVKAEHFCMKMRGVKEACSDTATAIMRGDFATKPGLKDEFYKLMNSMKGHG